MERVRIMDKKLAIYPMTRDACAVARNSSLLQGHVLSHIFAPRFTELCGTDISHIDGGSYANVSLSDYCCDTLKKIDVLFVDYDENLKTLSLYNDIIDEAIMFDKKVICSRKLVQQLRKEPIPRPYDVSHTEKSPDMNRLYEIPIPVITVLTQGERADQFAVELALRKYFIDEGYTVSQLGSYEASQFFGFNNLPNFLFEPHEAYEKALLFNHYVRGLVEKEESHLLILGVPGGIMKYNDQLLNGLGLLPVTVCGAVRGDLSILCMYHAQYNELFFDEMSRYGLYRYGTPINFFNVANTHFTPKLDNSYMKMFVDLKSDYVLRSIRQDIKHGEHNLCNVLDSDSAKNTCRAVHEALLNNVRYVK